MDKPMELCKVKKNEHKDVEGKTITNRGFTKNGDNR